MIGLSALGFFREDINALSKLQKNSYENIFRMYSTENNSNYIFYNILNSVYIPTPLQTGTYYTITTQRVMPWTAISYNEYKSINLWWLIVLANNIYNPIQYPAAGTSLNIIKPSYVPTIIDNISQQLRL